MAGFIGFLNGFITTAICDSVLHYDARNAVRRALSSRWSYRVAFRRVLPFDIPSWIFTHYVGIVRPHPMSFSGSRRSRSLSPESCRSPTSAIGSNRPGARSMRLPRWASRPARVKMICFVLCSVLAGFAGMIQVLRLGSPLPSIGEGLELQAVAAAVIGGASLYGGIGTVSRSIGRSAAHSHHRQRSGACPTSSANWFKFAIGTLLTVVAVVGERLATARRRDASNWRCERWRPPHHRVPSGLHKWYSGVHALEEC